jgi:2-oxo-4-hydroxy-4-carboxy-5-ureidoimidazoline decarboxylase
MTTLDTLNAMNLSDFEEALGGIFEHSPWVALGAYAQRPFASVEQLHEVMTSVVAQADKEKQLELIRAHPDLGSRAKMAEASVKEQAGAGLNQLTADEYKRINTLNKTYTEKFGFPFIFAVKGKSKEDVFTSIEKRVNNKPDKEFKTALEQICKIAKFRLEDKLAIRH